MDLEIMEAVSDRADSVYISKRICEMIDLCETVGIHLNEKLSTFYIENRLIYDNIDIYIYMKPKI